MKSSNLDNKKLKKDFKIFIIFIYLFTFYFGFLKAKSEDYQSQIAKRNSINTKIKNKSYEKKIFYSSLNWEKEENSANKKNNIKEIKWEKLDTEEYDSFKKSFKFSTGKRFLPRINSLNRSLVFDEQVIGPDVSWLVPPGFSWSKRYTFDSSIRGHNRRKNGEKFLAWNGGDAVGQFYYQPFHFDKGSFGFNLGMRSVYAANTKSLGGGTDIGEGLSLGFRYDRSLSLDSGFAIGGEQILQFDGVSDTGRDLYISFSKGWWRENKQDNFPLYVANAALATGKMAEGNIKGLCSDLLGGSGTEVNNQRPLCWAPVFSLAKVFNQNFSTFFEYNSKFFLLGSSYSPFEDIPLRGTFAVQLSDHIDNYKIKNIDNMKWVFRISLGF